MKRQVLCLFLLFSLPVVAGGPFLFTEDTDKKQLTISQIPLPVLTYQYDVIEHENVPQNNPRRLAGCYVHPLYGLRGEILTDNAPSDHYHHHGIFWTWTHVGVHEPDGKITAFSLWESNTALKQHFFRWIDKNITPQMATFEVENGWFIGDPKDGKKIMTERVKVIVHGVQRNLAGTPVSRSVDFEFQWQPTDKPITLQGAEDKSYGGFTMRFKPFVPDGEKEAKKSEINRITIPTGIAEGDLPETPLAWAGYTSNFTHMITLKTPMPGPEQGATKPTMTATTFTFIPRDQPSGAAIFVPKTHPDFPPTWLTRYYGPLCVGWPGVKGQTFQPGEEIKLRYRVWIHEGEVTVPQIEKAYEEYNKRCE